MFNAVLTISKFALYEAVRSRLIWTVTSIILLAILITLFFGQISLTESRETQAGIMAGFMRIAGVLTLMFYVVASVARDFQDKSVELLFALNIQRYQVFLGKLAGLLLISLLMGTLFGVVLLPFADTAQVLIWSFSLSAELALVSVISLVFILSLEHIALSLSMAIGFYALARVMPAIQSIGEGPFQEDLFNRFINGFMDLLDLVLPRLGEFTKAEWVMYNTASLENVLFVLAELVLYLVFFSLVGLIDIYRKAI